MTTYFRKAEIALMLSDFGVDVTVDGVTVKGIVDREDVPVMRGAGTYALGKRIIVTVETGALPALANGVTVVVDGESWTASDVRQVDDGALTVFACTRG